MGLFYKSLLAILFAFSILFKGIYYISFLRLKKAGQNMSGSNHELVKQLKRRFTDCYTLDKPVTNTESYVKKTMAVYFDGNIFLRLLWFFNQLSLGLFYISLWLAFRNKIFDDIKLLFFLSIATICYCFFTFVLSTKDLRSDFAAYATDYLDNTLKNRLATPSPKLRRETIPTEAVNPKSTVKPLKKPTKMEDRSDSEIFTSVINEFL